MSLVERGHLARLRVEVVRAISAALDVALPFEPRWRGADLAKLLDEGHATLMEFVIQLLRPAGWEILPEYSFNRYGDRGVVDIVAWMATRRTLLVVEIKTRIADIQDLLGTLDRKCRVVPDLLAHEKGWHPIAVGRIVVIAETSVARGRIAAHATTFEAALPARNREVRRWLARPSGELRGLWFVRPSTPGDGKSKRGGSHRIRMRAMGP